ncbi:uncharacterized protein PG998_000551 [Apiospora kogelbergensis]|uniref:uncharacterized protein n=1 Tax=Apiospora kogelbergensis TaxID=1337665 RepID=UPI0031315072
MVNYKLRLPPGVPACTRRQSLAASSTSTVDLPRLVLDSCRRPGPRHARDGQQPSASEPPPDTGDSGNASQDNERSFRPVLVDGDTPGRPSDTIVKEARYRRQYHPKTDTDMSALFRRIVDQSKDKDNSEANDGRGRDLGLVSDIAQLESMVDSNASVSEAYRFLKTRLYPIIRQEGVNIPQIFFPVVQKMMQKMISVKIADLKERKMSATDLPPLAEIFRVCVDVGELDYRQWAAAVERLVENLCETNAYEKHLATRNDMLTDLVESWKVLSLPKHVLVEPEGRADEIIDGFWFPRVEKSAANKLSRSYNFVQGFSSLFPYHNFAQTGPRISMLAIATYALLLDRTRSNANVRQGAARFMSKIAHMLSTVRLRSSMMKDHLSKWENTYPATSRYILAQWSNVHSSLEQYTVTNVDPRIARHAKALSPHRIDIEKRLSRAHATRKVSEVDLVWHDFISKGSDLTPERLEALQEEQDIFNSFINTYMAMNDPDRAIIVWNTLPKLGLRPTLKTWNVMLDGCKKARNLDGLNTVWSRLQSSGLALDIPIWTTRVAGLIECGDPKSAIKALEELVNRWHAGQKKNRTDVLQPTIEPVNAAISGLIRLDKLKAAQSLLTWASKQGIRPDVVTFNLIMRSLIRDGREKEVKGLLDTMNNMGISADAATFTVVLDGTLAHIPLDDIKTQTELVKAVFQKMEEAGLKPNPHTYGKMIYLLLRSGDRAQESVKIVLSHLWSQGYELSPHIYTMLVEHYFSRHPPDLDAVNGLLLRRRLLDYDDMDRVFYERVIKGFVHVGDLAAALDVYRKLHAAGFLVELDAQFELVRALVRDGGEQGAAEARHLVEGAMARFRELHGDDWKGPQHFRFWGHAFWHLTVRTGILRELPVQTNVSAPGNMYSW